MILKNKRDIESFIREKNVNTMKENPYLEENDIVVTSTGNAYKVVSTITEIPLLNDLYAEIITQDIDGNITSANKLSTARNISLKGNVEGNIDFDGTEDVSINVTVNNDSHTHSNATIESLDASKITSGTIDIARLPKAALERLVKVQDDTARFALTTNSVQLGDTVHVVNTNKMYIVIDESKLNSESGYQIYVAGRAAEVPWSGVTDKPTTMPNPNPLTISLNGSSQGAYDGNTSKNINITPSSIGAAASSHGVHVTYGSINPKIASSSPSAGVSSDVSRADHVHLEQTNIAGNAGTATKLETPRNINGHSFDGTSDITLVPKDIGAEPAFVKNTAFNKNFGTDVNTVLEGNKLAEMLGGTYAGSLNNSNQKTVDSIYYDSTTKQFYKCIKAGTVNYADASYFTSVSMKSLSDRLDNLSKDIFQYKNVEITSSYQIQVLEGYKYLDIAVYPTSTWKREDTVIQINLDTLKYDQSYHTPLIMCLSGGVYQVERLRYQKSTKTINLYKWSSTEKSFFLAYTYFHN